MSNRVGWKRTLVTTAGVAALAAACTGTEPISDPGPPAPVDLGEVRLVAFDSCDGLLDWFRTEGTARMGPYGLQGGGEMEFLGGDVVPQTNQSRSSGTENARQSSVQSSAAESSSDSASSADAGGTSTTNTQEPGIGEPDLTWTDGAQLVTVVNGSLQVVDLAAATVTATVELSSSRGASPIGLMVDGDHAVVVQRAWAEVDDSDPEGNRPGRSSEMYRPGANQTLLTRVDLGTDPSVVGEVAVDGDYVDARMIDGVIRAVVRSSPADLGWVYPSGGSESSQRRAEEANRTIIDESTIGDWLPSMTVTTDGTRSERDIAVDCAAVDHPTQFGGFETVTVVGLDLGAGAVEPLPSAAVVAGAGTVYASSDHLYVTSTRYPDVYGPGRSSTTTTVPGAPAEITTDVHSLSLPTDVAARYEASGSVPGQLLNQFALSQHEGDLRVATTTTPTWSSGPTMPMLDGDVASEPTARPDSTVRADVSESRLTVLRPDGDQLTTIGEVTGLGPTEQIRGVRFAGPLAYVVTFRQTDPLYVVDLHDPTTPVVAGELKIPGFSSYLQDLGDGRVLGLGQDATETGRATGFQESLFDVSDPGDPRRLAQLVVPASQSQAESDHHAVLWWAPDRLLAVPFTRWGDTDTSGPTTGVMVTHVDDAGITEVGTITHPDTTAGRGSSPCPPGANCVMPIESGPGYGYPTQIARTLVADGRLVTVSNAGVKVSDMATLGDISWTPLA